MYRKTDEYSDVETGIMLARPVCELAIATVMLLSVVTDEEAAGSQ